MGLIPGGPCFPLGGGTSPRTRVTSTGAPLGLSLSLYPSSSSLFYSSSASITSPPSLASCTSSVRSALLQGGSTDSSPFSPPPPLLPMFPPPLPPLLPLPSFPLTHRIFRSYCVWVAGVWSLGGPPPRREVNYSGHNGLGLLLWRPPPP